MSQQTGPVTITGIEEKSGQSAKGVWKLHKIKASDGNTYDTFDGPTAQKARDAGSNPVVLEYEPVEKNGYTNYTLKGVILAGGAAQAATAMVGAVPYAQAQAPSEKDAKITRLAAQRTAAQLIAAFSPAGKPHRDVADVYRKLVEELILHAETGRWATSQPVQPEQSQGDDLPWGEAA